MVQWWYSHPRFHRSHLLTKSRFFFDIRWLRRQARPESHPLPPASITSPSPSGMRGGFLNNFKSLAVGAAGLEPTTPGFGGRCSIQMSYVPGQGRFIARTPRQRKHANRQAWKGRKSLRWFRSRRAPSRPLAVVPLFTPLPPTEARQHHGRTSCEQPSSSKDE